MEKELESIIEATVQRVIEGTIEDIKSDLRYELDPSSNYARTESVLYKYPLLKKAIQERKEQITMVQKYGVPHKSKSLTMFYPNSGFVDVRSEYEKKEDLLEQLQGNLAEAVERIRVIEKAVGQVQKDPFFGIIEMKYFKQQTMEQIAKHFQCDVSAVQRHKNKLLSEIKFHLFRDDVLREMMEWVVG